MALLVAELLSKATARGHDVWIAGPASRDAVASVERTIGSALPPSYITFLLEHGAINVGDDTVSGIINNNANDGRGTILCDLETLADGDLPDGFLPVGPHEDGAYCIDLNRRRPDGECPVVNFEIGSVQHETPVASDFRQWLIEWRLQPLCEQDA